MESFGSFEWPVSDFEECLVIAATRRRMVEDERGEMEDQAEGKEGSIR